VAGFILQVLVLPTERSRGQIEEKSELAANRQERDIQAMRLIPENPKVEEKLIRCCDCGKVLAQTDNEKLLIFPGGGRVIADRAYLPCTNPLCAGGVKWRGTVVPEKKTA
jgi:hypothetical protein